MEAMTLQPEKLLAGHVALRCNDVASFQAYATRYEGRHERSAGSGPMSIELRRASLGRVEVGLLNCTVRMSVKVERDRSSPFLVQFPLRGAFAVEIDGREYAVRPGTGVVISPRQVARRVAEPGWTLALAINSRFLRSRLKTRARRTPAGRLSFQPLLGTNAAEIFNYCLLIVEAIDRGSARSGSAVATALEAGLADILLELQPHTCSRAMADTEKTVDSDRVDAVTELLRTNLGERLTATRLAEAAGCSVRALQATFLELCGMSPLEFVQRHRLARARELLEAAGRSSRIYQIAQRTGFAQLGRFAAAYKAMYGESPSDTLRRAVEHVRRTGR
jgi:AraC-like DNA-binding protein